MAVVAVTYLRWGLAIRNLAAELSGIADVVQSSFGLVREYCVDV